MRHNLKTILLCMVLASYAQAFQGYNIVVTTDPVSQSTFLANTTSQFIATEVPNPFVSNTYQINLYGINPNFNPLPTNADLLNALVTVDSWTYVNGWANGESYQQSVDAGIAGGFLTFCSSPTYFGLVNIDSTTCNAVAGGLSNTIFQMHLSTPIPVPGDFQ